MDDLIEALTIVKPYCTDYERDYPTGCDHDALYLNVSAESLPADVLARLDELSFRPSEEYAGALTSFKFGSC